MRHKVELLIGVGIQGLPHPMRYVRHSWIDKRADASRRQRETAGGWSSVLCGVLVYTKCFLSPASGGPTTAGKQIGERGCFVVQLLKSTPNEKRAAHRCMYSLLLFAFFAVCASVEKNREPRQAGDHFQNYVHDVQLNLRAGRRKKRPFDLCVANLVGIVA